MFYAKDIKKIGTTVCSNESLFAWLLLSGGLLMASCRKMGTQVQPMPSKQNVDRRLKPLLDVFEANPQANAIYRDIARTYGNARWEKASFSTSDERLRCLLPFCDDSGKVSLVLSVDWGEDLRYNLYKADDYSVDRRDPDSQRIARGMLFFQHKIGGHLIKTANGVSYSFKELPDVAPASNARMVAYTFSYCYDWTVCIGDGSGNCVSNTTYHSECFTDIIWNDSGAEPMAGVGEYPGYVDYPTGGGSSGTATVFEPPKVSIDVDAYLRCFDPQKAATMTIYADQPVSGYNEPISITGGIGHAFITIEQDFGSYIVRRTLGFYPSTRINPFNRTSATSQLGDDGKHSYDVSVTRQVPRSRMPSMLAAIAGYNEIYDIEKYNCVDFVIDVAAAGGIILPRTLGWWFVGRGANPGDFGQDLRKQAGATIRSRYAPDNTGSCPQ